MRSIQYFSIEHLRLIIIHVLLVSVRWSSSRPSPSTFMNHYTIKAVPSATNSPHEVTQMNYIHVLVHLWDVQKQNIQLVTWNAQGCRTSGRAAVGSPCGDPSSRAGWNAWYRLCPTHLVAALIGFVLGGLLRNWYSNRHWVKFICCICSWSSLYWWNIKEMHSWNQYNSSLVNKPYLHVNVAPNKLTVLSPIPYHKL